MGEWRGPGYARMASWLFILCAASSGASSAGEVESAPEYLAVRVKPGTLNEKPLKKTKADR